MCVCIFVSVGEIRSVNTSCIVQATIYVDLIKWEDEQKTEPPLTIALSKETILSAFEQPLMLPAYPNHTQAVERNVPVVTESCKQKVGYSARHR